MTLLLMAALLFVAPQEGDGAQETPSPAERRRPLDFRVFDQIEQPIAGNWRLDVPGIASRLIELKEVTAGVPDALVGREKETGAPVLRLERKKEGIGYEGVLTGVLRDCGLDPLPIDVFVSLGHAIVMKFVSGPTDLPCPTLDGGEAGRFEVVSAAGDPVRLVDLSGISGSDVRNTYSIGGDRPVSQSGVGTVITVDPGTHVVFIKRLKSPLDGSFWFEVEVPLAGQGIESPRGYVPGSSLRFIGSLTLERVP